MLQQKKQKIFTILIYTAKRYIIHVYHYTTEDILFIHFQDFLKVITKYPKWPFRSFYVVAVLSERGETLRLRRIDELL